jgi:hypothetical protein
MVTDASYAAFDSHIPVCHINHICISILVRWPPHCCCLGNQRLQHTPIISTHRLLLLLPARILLNGAAASPAAWSAAAAAVAAVTIISCPC